MDHSATAEAKAARQARRDLQSGQRRDPLAERMRLIGFWRACAETNRAYIPHNGAWWRPFTIQPGFRWVLMPSLRARIEARERAWEEKYRAELRESSRRWQRIKAERAAEKVRAKKPQMDLLT